jgi:hypothetical protein
MKKNLESKVETLRRALDEAQKELLDDLRERRRSAVKVVDDLDAQIARIVGAVPSKTKGGGKRAELRAKVRTAILNKALTQKEIADATGIPYPNVVQWIRNHEDNVKETGKRRDRRFLWKGE